MGINHFLVHFTSVITCVFYIVAASQTKVYYEKKDFRSMLPDDSIYKIVSNEKVVSNKNFLCARECSWDSNGSTFFENIKTHECRLVYEELTVANMTFMGMEGWKYYGMRNMPSLQVIQQPRNCSEAVDTSWQSGSYTIYPYGVQNRSVSAFCEIDPDNNVWTVIQRRLDGSVDFYQNWDAYKNGFGSSAGEYWIGNDVLHQLTREDDQELKIVMSDFSGITKYADYARFYVGDEASGYRLTISGYNGTAGDSMSYENSMQFTTYDRDNDLHGGNCAIQFNGAWWYNACHASNLNGLYLSGSHTSYGNGINWFDWHGNQYSLNTTVMMIKRN